MPKLTDKELGLSDNPMIKDSDPLASDAGEPEASPAIVAAAEAMRIKRRELIDQPLDRIWRDLAEVALAAAERE